MDFAPLLNSPFAMAAIALALGIFGPKIPAAIRPLLSIFLAWLNKPASPTPPEPPRSPIPPALPTPPAPVSGTPILDAILNAVRQKLTPAAGDIDHETASDVLAKLLQPKK